MLPFSRRPGLLLRWVLAGLAETAVTLPWLILLYAADGGTAWPEALPGAWLPLLVYLAAALWASGDRKEDPRRRMYALLVGVGISYGVAYQLLPEGARAGLLSWSYAVYFIPVAAYLWFQGARAAIEGLEYGRIFSRFSRQFIAQLVGILLLMAAGFAARPEALVLLYWSVILLFAAGLTLLLVTRERAVRADEANAGEPGPGGGSSPVLTGLVVALLALTLAASRLLSLDRLLASFQAVQAFISPLTDWLFQVAMLIIIRWVMLITSLIALIPRRPPPEEEGPDPELDVGDGDVEWLEQAQSTLNWLPYLKAALLILFLVLVLTWLYRLTRGLRQSADEEEERISLGFWRSLWTDLKGLLGLAARRVAPAVQAGTAALLGEEQSDPRSLFRRLQDWGASRGRPRREPETPSRYRRALGEYRPEADQPAGAVTAVYNQARYGAEPPSPEAVEAARKELERLEKGGA